MWVVRIALALVLASTGIGPVLAAHVDATLTLGNQTTGIASDPVLGKMFITNFLDGTLSVVDINTPTVLATVPVGSNPRRIAADAATHRVYVVNDTAPGTLTVVDAATYAIVAVVPVGNNPRALGGEFHINEVYVGNSTSNTVSVVDTVSNAVVATIPTGTNPLTPTTNNLIKKTYVPSAVDGTVTVIDSERHTVLKTVTVGKGPQYAAIDATHAKVYVNNVVDHTLSVIDSTTDSVIATIPTGAGTSANFASVSGVYHRAYLPNASDNTVTVINTDTDTVSATIPVGASPQEVVIDASGGDVYVVNQGSSSVTDIDPASELPVGTFAVGGAPWRAVDANNRLFVLNTNGNGVDSVSIVTETDTYPGTAIATEFYDAGFDHYFHTADDNETRLLLDGVFGDAWQRTMQFWRVWTSPGPGRAPVCRFFSATFAPKSSHFYTGIANECAFLTAQGIWVLESTAVYYVMLPDPASGTCPAGTAPLYRVYNNGQGGAPNHRLTPDVVVRNQMVGMGWVAEGFGPPAVYACLPPLVNH